MKDQTMRVMRLLVPRDTCLSLAQIRRIFDFAYIHILYGPKPVMESLTKVLNARGITTSELRVLGCDYHESENIRLSFHHTDNYFLHTADFDRTNGVITAKDNMMELPDNFMVEFVTEFVLRFANEEDRIIFELSRTK